MCAGCLAGGCSMLCCNRCWHQCMFPWQLVPCQLRQALLARVVAGWCGEEGALFGHMPTLRADKECMPEAALWHDAGTFVPVPANFRMALWWARVAKHALPNFVQPLNRRACIYNMIHYLLTCSHGVATVHWVVCEALMHPTPNLIMDLQ